MKKIILKLLAIFAFSAAGFCQNYDEGFENLTTFPTAPFTPISEVWELNYPFSGELPGSVDGKKWATKRTFADISSGFCDKHFSVYTDSSGEKWMRFCVDTDSEKGTTTGSDYIRTEINEEKVQGGSIGKTFEFEATFRINSTNLSGNTTYIPGTTKKAGDKVDFCQLHEEREDGFTKGKHNPPTLQIHLRKDNTIRLNYCPDRLRFKQDIGGKDERPGTKSVILYENYKNLEPIKIKYIYTGNNIKVWVNGVEKFDAEENTKKVFGANTKYKLYENKSSYMKFGNYANTWKGFQCVYVKDITAKIYDTGSDPEKAENHFGLKK